MPQKYFFDQYGYHGNRFPDPRSAKSAPKPQNTISDLIKYCRGLLLISLAFIIALVHIYLQ